MYGTGTSLYSSFVNLSFCAPRWNRVPTSICHSRRPRLSCEWRTAGKDSTATPSLAIHQFLLWKPLPPASGGSAPLNNDMTHRRETCKSHSRACSTLLVVLTTFPLCVTCWEPSNCSDVDIPEGPPWCAAAVAALGSELPSPCTMPGELGRALRSECPKDCGVCEVGTSQLVPVCSKFIPA